MALSAFVATSSEDREHLFRLRYEVFTGEQSKYTVIADHTRRRLVDAFDEVATHIAVADEGRIVGGLRQIRGRHHASPAMHQRLGLALLEHLGDGELGFSGRLCIEPGYRGSRALLQLLELNYITARDDGVRFDFIFCNPHIIEQYEALGYRRYNRYYSDQQLGFQAPMVLDGCDLAHLQSSRSPFARHAASRLSSGPDPVLQNLLMQNLDLSETDTARVMQRAGAEGDARIRAALERLLPSSVVMQCADGDQITPVGTPGREVFLVVAGTAALDQSIGGEIELGAGSCFGHDAFLAHGTHAHATRARGPARILVFSDRSLNLLAQRDPHSWAGFVEYLQRPRLQRLQPRG